MSPGGDAVAIPFSTLVRKRTVRFEISGEPTIVRWKPKVASALDKESIPHGRDVGAATVEIGGKPVPFSEPFWFAVAAFRPDTRIVR